MIQTEVCPKCQVVHRDAVLMRQAACPAQSGHERILEELRHLRALDTSGEARYPMETRWTIRFYEWLLRQPDCERKFAQFNIERESLIGLSALPSSVVARLGWWVA